MNEMKCPCGGTMRCKAGDTIQDGVYRWYVSSYCETCGKATELDGLGVEDLPVDIQREIIKESGEWKIFVKSKVSKVTYLVRKMLETYEAAKTEKDMRAVYRGTKNQALWIKNRLAERGIPESDMEVKRQTSFVQTG